MPFFNSEDSEEVVVFLEAFEQVSTVRTVGLYTRCFRSFLFLGETHIDPS
jgi:hypothetical protein